MRCLNSNDVNGLLSSIANVNAELDASSLSARTLSAVGSLIASDVIAFDKFSAIDTFIENSWNSDPSILTKEILERFSVLIRECPKDNPLMDELLAKRHRGALKISDFVSDRKFRKTRMYNDFLIDAGGAHMLAVILPVSSDLTISCAISRSMKDFSERDRQILSLLEPHLVNAVKNSLEYSRLQKKMQMFETLIQRVSRALILVDSNGAIISDSGFGYELLSKYSGLAATDSDKLSDEILVWLRCRIDAGPLDPLVAMELSIQRDDAELRISLVLDPDGLEHSLVLRERQRLSVNLLLGLGLTPRECEVLYWIAEGKSDEVIGIILGISPRTVHKHVEHIFQKLSVETRTAAVRCAIQQLEAAEI